MKNSLHQRKLSIAQKNSTLFFTLKRGVKSLFEVVLRTTRFIFYDIIGNPFGTGLDPQLLSRHVEEYMHEVCKIQQLWYFYKRYKVCIDCMISTTIILEKRVYAKLRLTHMAAKKNCTTTPYNKKKPHRLTQQRWCFHRLHSIRSQRDTKEPGKGLNNVSALVSSVCQTPSLQASVHQVFSGMKGWNEGWTYMPVDSLSQPHTCLCSDTKGTISEDVKMCLWFFALILLTLLMHVDFWDQVTTLPGEWDLGQFLGST